MDTLPIALYRPNPTIKVRPVELDDAPQMIPLWPNRTLEAVLRLINRIHRQAEQRRGQGLVILDDDHNVTGYGQITSWYRVAEIADLAIAEAHRGQGLGTTLIQHLIQVAQDMHIPRVEIGAAADNPRALKLYQRLGFEDARTIELDFGNGTVPVFYLYLNLE